MAHVVFSSSVANSGRLLADLYFESAFRSKVSASTAASSDFIFALLTLRARACVGALAWGCRRLYGRRHRAGPIVGESHAVSPARRAASMRHPRRRARRT